jgi:RNA polymerase sigma-B factor
MTETAAASSINDCCSADDRLEIVRRHRLIEQHLPLVRSLARRYVGRGEHFEDALQAGALGLVKAAERFDARRGVAFASFAIPTIAGEIKHFLRDEAAPVRLPRREQEACSRLRAARRELRALLRRAPTDGEVAATGVVTEEDLTTALRAELARVPVPLTDSATPPGRGPDPLADSEHRVLVARALDKLDRRERQIVRLRFYADLTQEEIARRLGMSQTHASRLIASALAKLERELDERDSAQLRRAG